MSRRTQARRPLRVMRPGKTQRDHDSGAWASHLQNQQRRRLETTIRKLTAVD